MFKASGKIKEHGPEQDLVSSIMGGGQKNSSTFLQPLSVTQKKKKKSLLCGHYPIITAFHLEEFSHFLLSVHLGESNIQYNQDGGGSMALNFPSVMEKEYFSSIRAVSA